MQQNLCGQGWASKAWAELTGLKLGRQCFARVFQPGKNTQAWSLLASMFLWSPESSSVLSCNGDEGVPASFLGPSVSDSATRWQWPQNNAWPEIRGAGSAFVPLFALGAPMYGWEPIHPAPKCQLKRYSSFLLDHWLSSRPRFPFLHSCGIWTPQSGWGVTESLVNKALLYSVHTWALSLQGLIRAVPSLQHYLGHFG